VGRKREVLTFPSIWNVHHRRNPFFTGREDILKNLHTTLTEGKTATLTQPQAISGLGGIGKTQVAIEYAYWYGYEYRAVLWVKADSREALISDFVSIADPLDLPEKNEQDQNRAVNAVKRWLQKHGNWLLILDNVEDLEIIDEFVNLQEKNGKAKPYQVREFLQLVEQYDLELGG
jgi:signal recognition particle GTPase